MSSDAQSTHGSKLMFWVGWVITVLPVLMMLFSASMKFMQPADFEQNLEKIGWKTNVMLGLGVLESACTVLYVIPRTAVLGAILLTGYLGGAVATHVRVNDPSFFFPVVLGMLVWGGLYLRDPRLRTLLPLRS